MCRLRSKINGILSRILDDFTPVEMGLGLILRIATLRILVLFKFIIKIPSCTN
jgi:hypothetical protein